MAGIDRAKARAVLILACSKHMETVTGAIADDARRAVPVKTGDLRRSIYHRVLPFTGSTVTGRIGATAHYAIFVEKGTRYMAAQPFLRPALYRRRGTIATTARRSAANAKARARRAAKKKRGS